MGPVPVSTIYRYTSTDRKDYQTGPYQRTEQSSVRYSTWYRMVGSSSSSPSSSFSLPRLRPLEIGRRRSKSTITGRFRVVTGSTTITWWYHLIAGGPCTG
ncbi:hypothetical protein B296_00048175 [Ensete ventricosum]|uniref:Uncharacterized protein n=1 Tax=Ensete ventricosum TaxID=4639 RepID=A0A426XH80_ENSVE|nr:hypothetical protein B296_00048175 [Ensete ventricosum]